MKTLAKTTAVILAIGMVVTSCATYSQSKKVARYGGVGIVVGALVLIPTAIVGIRYGLGTDDVAPFPDTTGIMVISGLVAGGIIVVSAVLTGSSGLVGMWVYDPDRIRRELATKLAAKAIADQQQEAARAQRVREEEAARLDAVRARIDRPSCLALRRERSKQAQASSDLVERTRILLALPNCDELFPIQR